MAPATAALHRAMSYARLTDGGMNPADARILLAETAAGDDWTQTASSLSDRRADAAALALVRGQHRTAELMQRWAVGAALFAQMAENTDTDLKRSLYGRYVDQTRQLAALPTPVLERIETPYRTGRLTGWLRLPRSGCAEATVIMWGGLTGWGAAYLRSADALAERGVACLLAEGPGQGEPRLRDGLHVDTDTVAGFARFVDVVAADPRMGDAIGVQGNSSGGLFAAHLAAIDDRIRACVVNGAPAAPTLPRFRSAREQLAAEVGTSDDDEINYILAGLRFDPHSHPIRCPVLVLHGGSDPLVASPDLQQPFVDAAGDRGELRIWSDGDHALHNHAEERDAFTADWFAGHLMASP
ncbi:alpha/beta hydrolase family protein [Gordonia rhizosphera]|nr:alpha/beta hydrolase [Gordonia rhizosphera]